MQTDPVGYVASMNLYQYCSNDPINWIDPFGEDTYRINNMFNKSKPTNSFISHSFMVTTDRDPISGKEKVVSAYSWVNSNKGEWEDPLKQQNIERAQQAIDTGVGAWKKGDELLDKYIDEAFEERKGEKGGFWPGSRGTCKDQANKLLKDALKKKAIEDARNQWKKNGEW